MSVLNQLNPYQMGSKSEEGVYTAKFEIELQGKNKGQKRYFEYDVAKMSIDQINDATSRLMREQQDGEISADTYEQNINLFNQNNLSTGLAFLFIEVDEDGVKLVYKRDYNTPVGYDLLKNITGIQSYKKIINCAKDFFSQVGLSTMNFQDAAETLNVWLGSMKNQEEKADGLEMLSKIANLGNLQQSETSKTNTSQSPVTDNTTENEQTTV